MTDWAEPAIKIDLMQTKLKGLLNDKKHSEAFSLLLDMQAELLKLQQYVIYGVTHNAEVRGRPHHETTNGEQNHD